MKNWQKKRSRKRSRTVARLYRAAAKLSAFYGAKVCWGMFRVETRQYFFFQPKGVHFGQFPDGSYWDGCGGDTIRGAKRDFFFTLE